MANRLTFKVVRERYHDDVLKVSLNGEVVGFSQATFGGKVIFRFKSIFRKFWVQNPDCPWFWEHYSKEFDTLAEMKKEISKNRKLWIEHFSEVIEVTKEWTRKKEEGNGKSE